MEKEYFYMFSQGSYSDYCVGGLYKSKLQLDIDWFGEYLSKKLIEQYPEAEDFIKSFNSNLEDLSGWSFGKKLYTEITKDFCDWNLPYKERAEYYGRAILWEAETKFNNKYIEMAVEDGILEAVHYEEVHTE